MRTSYSDLKVTENRDGTYDTFQVEVVRSGAGTVTSEEDLVCFKAGDVQYRGATKLNPSIGNYTSTRWTITTVSCLDATDYDCQLPWGYRYVTSHSIRNHFGRILKNASRAAACRTEDTAPRIHDVETAQR